MTTRSVILIVCNRVPFPLKDGGAMAMYTMIKGWKELGKKVHLLAMNTSRHKVDRKELPPLFNEIEGFEMVELNTDIHLLPVIGNFILSRKPQHAERFYQKPFARKLAAVIKRIEPDIVFLESIYLHEYAPIIRKYGKSLMVQRLHNIEAEVWQRLAQETQNPVRKFYLNNLANRIARYESKVWQGCDGIIPISNPDAAYIRDKGCETPALTISYGIDVGAEPLCNETSQWNAYHIGAMDWRPNVEAMEWMRDEIVPAILEKTPGFSFHFAGRNMPVQFAANKDPFFYCDGEVDNADNFICDRHILIVPLRSGSGIRIKTLEAMAAGKLVISTGTGIQGIEALDKIHFLRADTPEEFAVAIAWCMNNGLAAQKIARNAFDLLLANHNQKKLMGSLAEFVEKLP